MKYINIYDLWNKADGAAGHPITQEEVEKESGVTQQTISKMKRGGECHPKKLEQVAEALYKLSPLKRPKKLVIVWSEYDSEATDDHESVT